MIAVIKSNGNKVTGKAAEVFVQIGIAEELKEVNPIITSASVADIHVVKQHVKSKPVIKAKQSNKTKKGRPAKK